MVKSMAEKSGRMAVVLPQGTLFRGGVEGQIRKYLLEQDWVETVIGLAPNLFYGTGLAACVLILKKKKSKARKEKVLIVDASSLFRKGRAQNYLDPEHADQISGWVKQFEEIQDRARVVTMSQIKEEDWTLNISRYVLPPIGEDIPPLDVAIEDFKAAWERAQGAEAKLRELLKQNNLLEAE
jgi:type I restriction enzyme M protein